MLLQSATCMQAFLLQDRKYTMISVEINTSKNKDDAVPTEPAVEGSRQSRHYTDVIMTTTASQIPSLPVVYSTVYWDADKKKHQSSASLAFMWGIYRDRWIPRTKGQLRGKCFHLLTSSWNGTEQTMDRVHISTALVFNFSPSFGWFMRDRCRHSPYSPSEEVIWWKVS